MRLVIALLDVEQFDPKNMKQQKDVMKTKIFVSLGALALLPALAAQAQTSSPPKHREMTVWVASPTGSHLGAGYTSSYLTNIRARTMGKDDPKLREAVNALDGMGMRQVRGFGLLPASVAWQTETRMRTLIQQQADTGLSYGELLLANTLAAKSKRGFAQVVAMRARTRSWGDLANELNVDPNLLVTRANAAAERIVAVDFRMRHKPQREGGTNYTSLNPHTQRSRLY